MVSDHKSDQDFEATDQELRGVVYTGVSFAAFLLLLIGGIIYLLC